MSETDLNDLLEAEGVGAEGVDELLAWAMGRAEALVSAADGDPELGPLLHVGGEAGAAIEVETENDKSERLTAAYHAAMNDGRVDTAEARQSARADDGREPEWKAAMPGLPGEPERVPEPDRAPTRYPDDEVTEPRAEASRAAPLPPIPTSAASAEEGDEEALEEIEEIDVEELEMLDEEEGDEDSEQEQEDSEQEQEQEDSEQEQEQEDSKQEQEDSEQEQEGSEQEQEGDGEAAAGGEQFPDEQPSFGPPDGNEAVPAWKAALMSAEMGDDKAAADAIREESVAGPVPEPPDEPSVSTRLVAEEDEISKHSIDLSDLDEDE